MARKIVTILLVIILILSSLPVKTSVPASAAGETKHQTEVPAGYIGISTIEDLNNVRNNLSGQYILMNNIDLSEATSSGGSLYNQGSGWVPIGTAVAPFTGTFDGNGYKISGLKVSIKSNQLIYAGLFGYSKGGKILNLGMEDGSIYAENTSLDSATSKSYAGGLVGYGSNVTITNSYNTGSVTAQSLFDGFAGGIVGFIISSTNNGASEISNSYNTGVVNAKTSVGGIAGEASKTQFVSVQNMANIKYSGKYTGGIVGKLSSNSSIINASNKGDIQYGGIGGGIVGYASISTVSNSHNEGDLSTTVNSSKGGGIVGTGSTLVVRKSSNNANILANSEYAYAGGIAGNLSNESSVSESYNNGDIETTSYSAGIVATAYSSVISQVYNTGMISGSFSGGIAAYSSYISIINSFNIGSLSARYDIGGIVALALSGTTVKNTYNAGKVESISFYYANKGGLVGENEGTIENSYYLDKSNSGAGTGSTDGTYRVTFEQMKERETYSGFDFSEVWQLDGASGYFFPSLGNVPGQESEQYLDLALTSMPAKTTYIQGEELDLTGAEVTVRTNYGKQDTVPVTFDMVTGYDKNKSGTQSVKITYKGYSVSFKITVKEKYSVVFKGHEGEILKTEEVVEGQQATAPAPPQLEGYTFTSWSTDFSNVKSDLTVSALYDIITYKVTFKDGNEVLFEDFYNHGDFHHPTSPVKKGYQFLGWYKDSNFKTQFSYEPITSDLVLYAKFELLPAAPEKFAVASTGYDKVKLTWTPVKGADGYIIVNDPLTAEGVHTHYYSGGNLSSVTIESLKPGVTYNFKVKSYKYVDNEYVESPESQKISAKPVFKTPSSPKAVSAGYNSVKLTWKSSPDAEGYEIFRADSSSGTYRPIKNLEYPGTLSYTNSGLQTGKRYYYKVRAYQYRNGKKVYSSYSTVVSAVPALASSSAKATSVGYDRVKLTWSKSPEATGYEIYRADSSKGSYKKVKTITNNSTFSYTNSSLSYGKKYYYKVRAYKTVSGKKIYSSYSSVASAAPVIPAVKVKAVSSGYKSVKVSWSLVSGAHGYEVYRATSKTGTYSKIKTITSSRTSSYVNGSLSTGKTYYYKVRAYRTIGSKKVYSSYSTVVNAVPVLASSSSKATSAGHDSVKLTWSKSPEATGYEIYRATSSKGSYNKVKTVTNNRTFSYTNSSLSYGKKYYYKVRAYKTVSGKKYYSSYSGVASASPVMSAPKAKAVSAGNNSVKVSWGLVSGAHGYEVYRATSKTGTYSKIKTITSSRTSSYVNGSLSTGKTYYYKVKAYRNTGSKKVYSSFSGIVSAVPR